MFNFEACAQQAVMQGMPMVQDTARRCGANYQLVVPYVDVWCPYHKMTDSGQGEKWDNRRCEVTSK